MMKQGELDGLCGIYALTAYLRDIRDRYGLVFPGSKHTRADDAFWVLLDAAQRLQMFNVDYFLNGYSSHHLVKIWNEIADCLSIERVAFNLTKIAQLNNHRSLYDVAKIVVEDQSETALFILLDDHWHLARAMKGGSFEVDDASPSSASGRSITKRRFGEEVSGGFVILPKESSLLVAKKELK